MQMCTVTTADYMDTSNTTTQQPAAAQQSQQLPNNSAELHSLTTTSLCTEQTTGRSHQAPL